MAMEFNSISDFVKNEKRQKKPQLNTEKTISMWREALNQ